MNSLVIPVYKNEANLERLLAELLKLAGRVTGELEVVFVVDGSPDRCLQILRERLPTLPLRTQLLSLSRNFGSFAAIAAGLERARGNCMAVMAADLQEPPELVLQFFEVLDAGRADIVFGMRGQRSDPWFSEFASNIFWFVYRKLVVKDMPPGGVDIFGCTREVRDRLLRAAKALEAGAEPAEPFRPEAMRIRNGAVTVSEDVSVEEAVRPILSVQRATESAVASR